MSQRYPNNGHGYASNQLPNPQRAPFSNDMGHLPTSFPTQPLPPLSAPDTPMNDSMFPRIPHLQTSAVSNAQHFPVYAPTANSYMQHGLPGSSQHATFAPSQTFQAGPRPSYTAGAPPNLQLPKIQPAPMANGDHRSIKPEPLQPLNPAPPVPEPETTPKHVVGSQGRRGILPSASGRPPAPSNQNMNNGKSPPAKDADGKYPCPHCSKPYLHAKHLKRHMLRHTGVRPYECALCHDTFSRSDILKRHFTKCSARRGNPTGENHLAYSRANKKNRQAQEEEAAAMVANAHAMTTDQSFMPTYTTSLDSPIGLAAMDLGHGFDRQEPLANQVTRSNEFRKASGYGPTSNRGSTSSMGAFDNPAFSTGHVTPDSVTTSGAATPYTYPHERSSLPSPAEANFNHLNLGMGGSRLSSSGYPNGQLPQIVGQSNGRANDSDWSHFQTPLFNDDFNSSYHSGTNTPQHNYKPETDISHFEWPSSLPHRP